MTRALALVDGEHYPATTRWALASARAEGYDVVACLFVGGTEKVPANGLDLGQMTVEHAGGDLGASLSEAIDRHRPEVVLDLSDEPVLGYRERSVVAAQALAAGVRYVGPDFALEPPVTGPPLSVPTLAVIGTGKRAGKTAITGEAGRVTAAAGLDPVVVAMGRGGPPGPQVAEAGSVTLQSLLDLAGSGEHAASDYLEDALTTGVTTIGTRRAGGGLGGRPFVTNMREGAALAERRQPPPGLVILDASGSAVPPLPWDAGVLVAPVDVPVEYLTGYLGPFRLLLSDLIVLTMLSGPRVGPQRRSEDPSDLTSHVRRLHPGARIVVTKLRPVPLGDVEGKKVYLTTTAPPSAGPAIVSSLEEHHRCSVIGVSHRLADRSSLITELESAPPYDVLLTELKAAAVDVAAQAARAKDAEVVFLDNRPETAEGDGDVSELLLETARLAVERAGTR
jgi:cyclic 2,3-diphosphoglycerate synthetase